MTLIEFEDTFLIIWITIAIFVMGILFELYTRMGKRKELNHNKPHSTRIDKGLARLKSKKIDKITNDVWQELTGVSDATATRDLVHLVELGVLKKRGRGRGVHYAFVKKNAS